MQSAVLATAIPSVRLSAHAGNLSRQINVGSHGLYYEVSKHASFLTPTTVGGDVPFHRKFALKVTDPLKNADFDQYNVSTVTASETVQLSRIGIRHALSNEL